MSEHKTLIGYARVSTRGQDLALQLDALERAGCERVYKDVGSGTIRRRPELDACLDYLRAGDTLVVWRLDRLGRSLRHLVELVGELARARDRVSVADRGDRHRRRRRPSAAAPVRCAGGVRAGADPRAFRSRARGRPCPRPARWPTEADHAGEARRRRGDARSGRADHGADRPDPRRRALDALRAPGHPHCPRARSRGGVGAGG